MADRLTYDLRDLFKRFGCADVYDDARSEAAAEPWTSDVDPSQRRAAGLTHLFEQSGIPERFARCTLRSYVDLCERHALSLDGKRDALRAARAWMEQVAIEKTAGGVLALSGRTFAVDGSARRHGLLLHGPSGVGKTGILTACARAAIGRGYSVLYVQYNAFIDAVQSGYATGESDKRLRAAMDVDVVLLDDLGDVMRREETDDRREILWKLVNARYNASAAMLVTSNLSLNAIADQFAPRTLERLKELCLCVYVQGANLRFDGQEI